MDSSGLIELDRGLEILALAKETSVVRRPHRGGRDVGDESRWRRVAHTHVAVAQALSGEKGIRTPGTLAGSPDFESGSFGHSDISPWGKFVDPLGRVKRSYNGTRAKRKGFVVASKLRSSAAALLELPLSRRGFA